MRVRSILMLVLVLGFLPAAAALSADLPAGGPLGDAAPVMAATMVPGTVIVEAEIESQVLQALTAATASTREATYYAITDLRREDGWLFVSVAGLAQVAADLTWTLDDAVWVGLVLLHQEADGRWSGAVEGTDAFSHLLTEVPETVLDARARESLDRRLRSLAPAEAYVFPWEPGTRMQYGMLGVHSAGFISGWKAVDFFSDADTGAGHAPNRLLAAAPGSISYVCRDGTSAAVRMGDLLYVHLLDNSKLTVGHTFGLREEMGQLKTGSFNDVCGWASQGSNWFHLHWGFPNTGTFEAGGWTLSLSDGLWRRGDETAGIYAWFEAESLITPVGTTGRASVASDGAQGDGGSYRPAISADGRYVAFSSEARNLVSDDTNNTADAFVHDRRTGQTERVSISSAGTEGNDLADQTSISAGGRYVAFWSSSANLVSDDTNNAPDIFLRDRATGETERVSVSSEGLQANGFSYNPSISGDGRYIVFYSYATNLVSNDTNGSADVFLHDQETGQTTRVSVSSAGGQGDGDSVMPSISADGRYLAFWSSAGNLVGGDTNGQRDVFRHDRLTGQTLRVSVASGGTQGIGETGVLSAPALSADGRLVAFHSGAWNLVSGDTNSSDDVFLHDCDTGQTRRVSVSSGGSQANAWSRAPSLSRDGRYVAFVSWASNLVGGDTNARSDVFLHDRQTGRTERLSIHTDGNQGDDDSDLPSISADGRYVAFDSLAGNLVESDGNGFDDVFVHDREGSWPYTISGRVVHPNLLPVPGVSVSAGGTLITTTDSAGDYLFALNAAGTYTLTPSLSPFVSWPVQHTVRVPSDALGRGFTLLARPVSVTLSAGISTTLTYTDTQGLATTLAFPAGTVSETVTLILTPTLAPHLSGYAFAGHAFHLSAYGKGALLPGFAFSLPVTITIGYSEADVRVVSHEDQLLVHLQTEDGWGDAGDTCTPSRPYRRDLISRLLTIPICRTGTLGLYGPTHQSYLPLVLRRF
jgi:Tol biopolymer transport system component